MEVEIVEHEEDSASAGRGEGGADGRAHARPSGGDGRAHARPSDAAAPPARPASAGDITRMVMARLARRYLAMPATSASVERLFSVAGQVVTAKRARLDPTTVTLLVFLHEAIPGGVEREAYDIIEGALAVEDD
jgi:hypothetical protein